MEIPPPMFVAIEPEQLKQWQKKSSALEAEEWHLPLL
jgi:hypothetical protein